MRRRKLRLPVLTVRTLLLVCGALVVVCVGVGLAMRASLTDYAHDGAAVEQLPFVVNSRASTDALSLHTREEIAAADEAALPAEVDAAYTLGMASEEVLDEAPVVLTGTFTGERTYVYQAFQCQIEVTSVLRGGGVSEGDGLVVYDAYKITEPRNGLGTGQFSDVREVWGGSVGPSRFGLMPLRAGQEYLFFLEPKRYPSEKDPATYEQTYCLIEHPYARISLDLAEHPERVGVFELPADGEWQRIPFVEACQYDLAATDEAAKELYLENCARLLRRRPRGRRCHHRRPGPDGRVAK